ncbi:MFS transporter [Streptomyces mirabilis]|uniref:MFS transporter n=1 Tax=Streptomyces mirabilis TaxID=68239 RepID=UPI003698BCC5
MPLGEALDGAPMSRFHVRFWLLAGLGILLDGFDFFIIGVANPLVARDFAVGSALQGLISAAAIVGAMFGAALLGPLGDRIGRSRIFRLDLWMFVVFSVLCTLAWDAWSLTAFRFALGLAVGLDYPIAAGYLAEILPSKNRGRWLVGAFSLQAAGILLGAVVGVVVLNVRPEVDSWRIMLGFGVLPALLIIWLRRAVPESPRWLAQNGREEEAREIGRALAGVPVTVTGADRERQEGPPEGFRAFLQPQLFSRRWRRRTIFTAVPWFLMDIATYGVGIFTPTLLAAVPLVAAMSSAMNVLLAPAVRTRAVGLTAGPPLHGRGRVRPVQHLHEPGTPPAEVFPSEMRAAGHGFATGCGKLGAALGTFLFPVLLARLGESLLLYGVAVTSALGFLVTYLFRIEPRGRSLQELSGVDAAALAPRIAPP